ncbi:Sensor histidine kinase RcsC [Paraburkholderia hiiakae]|uniref:histidine kinase n=1 Tax=Paraburkholderia hiiakae TaxID=1081782 RepID=A0ABN7HRB7_9BURK|nr:hybrid sensor histidine kinase/response regulator [Paraburkholderia hiiakae]CAD6529107.1 Sensor histidine kinase RcsC [Paraburkholderia hiiakae]
MALIHNLHLPLPFAEGEQEASYQDDTAERFLRQRRLAAGLGLGMWTAFLFWDWVQSPFFSRHAFAQLLEIRFVGMAILAYVCKQAWTDVFLSERKASVYMLSAIFTGWLGLLLMMIVAPPNNNFREYYPGLFLCYYFLFTFIRVSARPTLILGFIQFLLFNVVEYIIGASVYYWFSASFFLICFCILGSFVAVQLEVAARGEFLARLRLTNAKAEVDIAMATVQERNEKMREMMEDKERFFAAAYHDIQQPLAAIRLFLQAAMVKASEFSPTIQPDLAIIDRSAADIFSIFKDIRDYSELGNYEVNMLPANVQDLISEVHEQYAGAAKSKGLDLRLFRGRHATAVIVTDKFLLKRVLLNLMSNAIKYTERGGIVLGWVIGKEIVRIDVVDTGLGIPEEYFSKIFDEYYQVNNPGRDRSKGLGLGLSIVRRIQHILPCHQLSFTSIVGKGSRFSVYVPLSTDLPAANADRETTRPALSGLVGRYAIVCDDEPTVLQGLKGLLEHAGMLTDTAESLSDVEQILQRSERAPDVIVTDYRLQSGYTGADVIAAVRSFFDGVAAIPVVIITGEISVRDIETCVPGPVIAIGKASTPEELMAAVNNMITLGQSLSQAYPASADRI